jgi:serine/threonine protein kinase
LKPANLFVAQRANGQDWCRLLDFGVVKSIATDSTQQGSFVGTVRYMAPEQILEDGVVGPWTDIYALGAILYECITGQAPYASDAVERVLFKILNERPRALDDLRPNVPADLCASIMRALSRDPDSRFPDAVSFARALEPHAGFRNRCILAVDAVDAKHERTIATAPPICLRQTSVSTRSLTVAAVAAFVVSGVAAWRFVERHTQRIEPSTSATRFAQAPTPAVTTTQPAGMTAKATIATGMTPRTPPSGPTDNLARSAELQRKKLDNLARSTVPLTTADAPNLLPKVDVENPYAK